MEKKKIRLSVRNLVEFIFRSGDLDNRRSTKADLDAMQKGSRIHRKIQGQMGADYLAEQSLQHTIDCGSYEFCLEGRADGIFKDGEIYAIDEIKGVYLDIYALEEPIYVHQAQAMCYAYLYAIKHHQCDMGVQITYCNLDTEEIRRFFERFSWKQLEQWFGELIGRYRKWLEYAMQWEVQRNASMQQLEFPFPYREGQRDLAVGVYRTIARRKQLFIQAPTGVGKTMSTVFPAIRAVGEGLGGKIFYLTAKTITRTVAEEAFETLKERGLKYKVVTITAKEKLCLCEEMDCNPIHCECAKGHFDRINDAVYELWTKEDRYDRETILLHAGKWKVCPFELCLDLALWVDAVICDYNYVFDPNVCLQRFFGEGAKKEDFIFLIDEAHNLVERGREMYSASIYKEEVLEVRKQMKPYSKAIDRQLGRINKLLLEYKRECETYEILGSTGNLPVYLMNLQGEMEKYMEEHPQFEWPKESLDFYFAVRKFMDIYEILDENYQIYTQMEGDGRFKLKLFCVNPAANLQKCLDHGASAVFFSATLLPVEYYQSLFSTRTDDYAIYAKSPFSQKNRCLLLCRDVSSKYTRRGQEEYRKIANYLLQAVQPKAGNYMAFFPSYQMLEEVYESCLGLAQERDLAEEELQIICQRPGMQEAQREEFLAGFHENQTHTLIGMCVMGGIFSEGIDLMGDRLIGAMIIGTGIPQISYEREILKQYYDAAKKNGFNYAYRFPGMNKVLQSAGRVIRASGDRGVILLLDERFLYEEYRRLFPREWEDYQICKISDVGEALARFWEEKE